MTLLRRCGVKAFVLHKIRAFCPPIDALRLLRSDAVSARIPRMELYERPCYTSGGNWEQRKGFFPTYTVGPSVSTWYDANHAGFLARIFRQGIGIVTQTIHGAAEEEDKLVELFPPAEDEASTKDRERVSQFLASLQDAFQNVDAHVPAAATDVKAATQLVYDTELDIQVAKQAPFEVVELEFEDPKKLECLATEQPVEEDLLRLIVYCLARNYGLHEAQAAPPALKEVAAEVNHGVFHDVLLSRPDGIGARNLSQTSRAFVALGRRGGLIGYCPSRNHVHLRVAALNMIEILRGRFHNMIIARTLMDQTLRMLSELALLDHGDKAKEDNILRQMMVANHLYGLVVSDPGVFLLDGSTLSALAEKADVYFQLRSLREDTERKINALQRFWHEYQDRRRASLVSKFAAEYRATPVKRDS